MHARNAGLQRLRSVTRRVGIATAVLTGVFAGLAAASNSGHHKPRVARRTITPRRPSPTTAKAATIPPAPSLPPLPAASNDPGQSTPQSPSPQPQPSPAPAPQPPPAPPVQSYAPPVTSSGGS